MGRRVWLVVIVGLLAVPARAELPVADARLDRPVRVTTEGIAVGELVARISGAAGIPLRTTGELVDEKVVAFGPERPLREVLADVAALFGARWQPFRLGNKDGYELAKEPRTLRLEAELAGEREAQWTAPLEAQVRALRESPVQLTRRSEADPFRKFLLDPKARLATELYARLNPTQRRFLIERGQLRVPFEELPLGRQAQMAQLARENAPAEFGPSRRGVAAAPGSPDLQFFVHRFSSGAASFRMYPGDVLFAMPRAAERRLPRHGDPFTGEPVPGEAPLPALERVALDSTGDRTDRLRRLSENTGLPVLADYYRLPAEVPDSRAKIEAAGPVAALDRLALLESSLWWLRGRSLLLRHEDWFFRRRCEIPDRWLDAAVASLRGRRDTATGADLLRLAELTYPQLLALAIYPETRASLSGAIDHQRGRSQGFPEVLGLLNAGLLAPARAQAPILSRDATESVEEQNRAYEAGKITATELPPALAARLPALRAAVQWDRPHRDLPPVYVTVVAREVRPGKRAYRYLPLQIEWRVLDTRGSVEAFLPLTIPDDRRERTVVKAEVVPG